MSEALDWLFLRVQNSQQDLGDHATETGWSGWMITRLFDTILFFSPSFVAMSYGGFIFHN
ncbi:hypothetical protein JVT61DRAFT_6682 [Boletus reticuloceps]|uniref:Uncharacterized protein n=1 Tax=Boletus reticuloceps TaxID=495285 RepID=A0A8I3A7J2_9AGAM|nr:hypothetical protein JVT61DRAFT_6682 [Boletus reticuloceps]